MIQFLMIPIFATLLPLTLISIEPFVAMKYTFHYETIEYCYPSPRMLLSFAKCTCSAQFSEARNNIA